MKALITGATSGIGKEFAIELSKNGYDLILIARNKEELNKLKNTLKTDVEIYVTDLTKRKNAYKIYNRFKNEEIDLIINNAGVGVFGNFTDTNIDEELDMMEVNLVTPHLLTKLFLKGLIEKDRGKILNVSSTAAFAPGPLMAAYYSTKSYIYNLTCSIYEELKQINSKVKVSVLCPGPVNTNFNNRIGIKFGINALPPKYVVEYTLKKLNKNQLVIIPGFTNRLLSFFVRILPLKFILKLNYKIQSKKVIK